MWRVVLTTVGDKIADLANVFVNKCKYANYTYWSGR